MSTGPSTRARRGRAGPELRERGSNRRAELRKRRRRRSALRTAASIAVGLLIVAGAVLVVDRGGVGGLVGGEEPEAPRPPVTALLVIHGISGQGADHIAVLATVPDEPATALFIPAGTVVDVPGHGMDQVGSAYSYGETDIVASSVTNLLGVVTDGALTLDARSLARVVDDLGGIQVDVPTPFTSSSGSRIVQLTAGLHLVDGATATALLGPADDDRTDLDRVSRADRVLRGLVSALLPESQRRVFVEGVESTLEEDALQRLVAGLAEAHQADQFDVVVLPVSPLADRGSLRPDQDRAADLVTERFAHALAPAGLADADRLQILNGNGRPGIGQEVARRVLAGGFRVVLTENADRFDHEETLVIVHGEQPARLAIARELVRLLGVGRVEIGGTPQSVADFTIVVGHDFLELVDPDDVGSPPPGQEEGA